MNGIVAGNWQTIDLLPDGRTFQSRIHFTPKFSVAVSVVQKNEKKNYERNLHTLTRKLKVVKGKCFCE